MTPLSRPDWLIWQVFPIAPPHTRISAATGTDSNSKAKMTSDSTRQLNKVITSVRTLKSKMNRVELKIREWFKQCNSLNSLPPATNPIKPKSNNQKTNQKEMTLEMLISKFYDAYLQLMTLITQFIDSDAKHIPFANQKGSKGLTNKLKRKEGRVRSNVNCKRSNFNGRAVISAADTDLDINEIGVPLFQCMNLTKPVKVTRYNIVELRKRILNGPYRHPGAMSVTKENGTSFDLSTAGKFQLSNLRCGQIVNVHIQTGNVILVNRQPSLHTPSLMAFKTRTLDPFLNPIMPIYTIKLPLAVTPAFNANFDGDEMNLHVPQTEEANAEARILMMPEHMIIPVHV